MGSSINPRPLSSQVEVVFTATKHLEQEPRMSGHCKIAKNALWMGKRLTFVIVTSASDAPQGADLFILLGQFDLCLIGQSEICAKPSTPMLTIPLLLPDPPDLAVATTPYEMRSEQTVLVFDPWDALRSTSPLLPPTSMATMGDLKYTACSLFLEVDAGKLVQ